MIRSFFFAILLIPLASSAQSWKPDVLGDEFERLTVAQPDDYEGKVVCTVIRMKQERPAKRGVLYIHGFNDYFFQREMACNFDSAGYAFYALDLRKYGRSYLPGQKFNNVRDLSEYFADIDTALRVMHREGIDHILLAGHSTGGLTVSLYAAGRQGKELFDSIFLNSPFLDMNLSKFLEKRVLPVIVRKGAVKPDKLMKGGLPEWYGYSLHKSEKGEWEYDLVWKPHIPPPVNYGWIRAISEGQKKIRTGISIGKPVLVMHSDRSVYTKRWTDELYRGDAVLSVEDISLYAKQLQGNVTVKIIPGGMHDLVLSQRDTRKVVYEQLFLWLRPEKLGK